MTQPHPPRTLVAGIGNVFLSDDGFGVEVASRMRRQPWPDHVRILDVGIRGVHLAHELMDGWDVLVLVDAAPRGEPPGTITVLSPDLPPRDRSHPADQTAGEGQPDDGALNRGPLDEGPLIDGHGLAPVDLLALLPVVGAQVGRVWVVACEPADLSMGLGLSQPVAAAVDLAVAEVRSLVDAG